MDPLTAEDPPAIGSYRLRARLGSGGMGRVYLGSSPAGRAVAIKVIHPELAHDETFRSRFRREVAAARQVSGAYTAPVVAAGLDGDPLWLATSFVAGPSLAAAVSAQGPFPEASIWRLAAGLAEALGAVHACGLVHRDLKPANVLLASDGPRLIDFGIARALDGTAITASGHIVGTPAFMSPEQAEGLATGPDSDVFSLGSVLAFAASGTPPFGTDRPATILYRVVHAEPALAGIPAALRPLITACLAKRAGDRPVLAELLKAIAAHWSPSGTGPPGEFWPETLAGLVRSYEAALPPAAGSAGPSVPGAPASVMEEYPPRGGDGQPDGYGQPDGPTATAVGMGAEPGPRGEPDLRREPGLGEEPGLGGEPGPHGEPGPRGQPAGGGAGTVTGTRPLAGATTAGEAGTHRGPPLPGSGPPGTGWAGPGPGPGPGSGPGPGHRPGRRQVLAGLAVVSAAALGVGGWELSRDGSSGPAGTGGRTTPPRAASGTNASPAAGTAPATGTKIWSVRLGTTGVSVPLAAGRVVYAGPAAGSLSAVNAGSGRQIQSYATDGLRSAPALAGGLIYVVGGGDGKLYALRPGGTAAWTFSGRSSPVSVYTLGNGAVYAAAGQTVYALRPADGAVLWTYPTSNDINTQMAAGGGAVYAGNNDSIVYALRASGTRLWSRAVGQASHNLFGSTLAVDASNVYVGARDQKLYALRASDGAARWSFPTANAVAGGPVVTGGVVYAGSSDGSVYAIRASVGSKLWSFATQNEVTAAPVVTGGVVYVASADGGIYALRADRGTEIWRYATGNSLQSGLAVQGTVVYAGDIGGTLYAIRAPATS